MFGVYVQLLKDKWKPLLVYIGSSLAFSEMYVALYPAMKDALKDMEQFLAAFPEEFMQAFGFSMEDLTFPTLESFLSTEMYNFMWPIILVIIVVSLANFALAGDIAKGTIELSLSQPISRLKLYFARYFAGLTNIMAFVWISTFGIIPLAIMHGIDYTIKPYFYMSILGTLFAAAVYGIAYFSSSFFSDKGKPIFITTGVLLTMYAGNIISGLYDKLDNLKYFSFFYYFNPGMAFNDLEFVEYAVPVFLAVAITLPIVGSIWFNRRNITS